MSVEEVKKVRGIQDIQGEYQALCAKAGHLQYQLYTFQKDLNLVNDTLRDLNVEASKMHQEEQAKKAEEAKAVENVQQ